MQLRAAIGGALMVVMSWLFSFLFLVLFLLFSVILVANAQLSFTSALLLSVTSHFSLGHVVAADVAVGVGVGGMVSRNRNTSPATAALRRREKITNVPRGIRILYVNICVCVCSCVIVVANLW